MKKIHVTFFNIEPIHDGTLFFSSPPTDCVDTLLEKPPATIIEDEEGCHHSILE